MVTCICLESTLHPPITIQPLAVPQIQDNKTALMAFQYSQNTQTLKTYGQPTGIIQTTVKVSGSGYYSTWRVPLTSVRSTKNQYHMESSHLVCFEV